MTIKSGGYIIKLDWNYSGYLEIADLPEEEQINLIIADMKLRGVSEHLINTVELLRDGYIIVLPDRKKARDLLEEGISVFWERGEGIGS